MLDRLKASAKKDGDSYPDEFDLLIVGGGATGAGVAVDAASRGLKVALVERADFSSGELTPVLALGLPLVRALPRPPHRPRGTRPMNQRQ